MLLLIRECNCRQALEIVLKFSAESQADSLLLSEVPALVDNLLTSLSADDEDPVALQDTMARLKARIGERFKYLFETPNLALICALLDPRYVTLPWVTPQLRTSVWAALLKEAMEVLNVNPSSSEVRSQSE